MGTHMLSIRSFSALSSLCGVVCIQAWRSHIHMEAVFVWTHEVAQAVFFRCQDTTESFTSISLLFLFLTVLLMFYYCIRMQQLHLTSLV